MKNRILFLTFSDMLLYSLLVKSRTKIYQEEVKSNICYTPPQAYFWIFLLNLKNNIILSEDKEHTLTRLIFWVMQIIYHLKSSFRDKKLHKKNLLGFYNQFKKELSDSKLNTNQKQTIIKLTEEKIKYIFHQTQLFLSKNFNKLSLKDAEYWGEITYESFADYFAKIYLIVNNISLTSIHGKGNVLFVKQISRIEALHDDITDIFVDIINGYLLEPNLFACFLSEQDKIIINTPNHNNPISIETANKLFPKAYKQYKKLVDKKVKEITSISGINIHQFLEFCFYHYPVFLSTNFQPDNNEKKIIHFTSVNFLAVHKQCLTVVNKFQQLINSNPSKEIEKQFAKLLQYVYCLQLFQIGLSNKEITNILKIPSYTVSRWLNYRNLPISIRHLKEKPIKNNDNIWFLLGIFSQAGTIKDGYFQIIRSKPILEKIRDRLNSTKNIIFKTKKYYYLRSYNASLARIVQQMKNNLSDVLKKASTVERKEFNEGLNIIKKKNILVKMQQNNITEKYLQYAKSLILHFFGSQKKEFWDEFPSLLYLCLSTIRSTDQKIIKYAILNFFKKHFHNITQTNIHISDTYDIERVVSEKDGLEKLESFDNQRLAKILNILKKKNYKQYLVLALRFGLYDGKEHTLTNDLSTRLFEHGVNNKNKPLSKSQTFQLLQSSLSQLRVLF